MDKLLEKSFSEFLETHQADNIFEQFQDMIRAAYLEGYSRGRRYPYFQVVYIADEKRTKD